MRVPEKVLHKFDAARVVCSSNNRRSLCFAVWWSSTAIVCTRWVARGFSSVDDRSEQSLIVSNSWPSSLIVREVQKRLNRRIETLGELTQWSSRGDRLCGVRSYRVHRNRGLMRRNAPFVVKKKKKNAYYIIICVPRTYTCVIIVVNNNRRTFECITSLLPRSLSVLFFYFFLSRYKVPSYFTDYKDVYEQIFIKRNSLMPFAYPSRTVYCCACTRVRRFPHVVFHLKILHNRAIPRSRTRSCAPIDIITKLFHV
jgi:hypothetical protein